MKHQIMSVNDANYSFDDTAICLKTYLIYFIEKHLNKSGLFIHLHVKDFVFRMV